MREIKFRAWSHRAKQLKQVERIFFNENTIQISHGFTGDDISEWFLDHCELMQYTGLKDRNGKEIYEGDVVKFSWLRSEIIDQIEYVKLNFASGFQLKKIGSYTPPACEWTIIGNIYQNPELIPNDGLELRK